jgi:hypothetical protein
MLHKRVVPISALRTHRKKFSTHG